MRVRVEAYAGHTANERPLRLTLGERTLEVREILDRWYGEDARYFRVRCDDDHTYVLKYVTAEDQWELVSFTRKDSTGVGTHYKPRRTLH